MASLDVLLVMALQDESQGLFEGAGLTPLYCGVGQVKAAFHLTKALQQHKPRHMINLGTAGSHKFSQNTLVECTSFIQRAPHDFFQMKAKVIQTEPITSLPKALCGTADFIESRAPFTPCDVFDMEAYALAYVCQQNNIKFNCVKFISDHSDQDTIQHWKQNLAKGAEALLQCYKEMKF